MPPTPRPQTARVATTRRESDGALVLRLEPRVFWDLDQAATALAIVYAGQRVWRGLNLIQDGLVAAASDRVLDQPELRDTATAEAIAAYRRVLLDTESFPDPATDDHSRPPGQGVPYRKRTARYRRPGDGVAVMRIDAPTFLSLEEAATALAMVYAGRPIRVGLNALLTGLQTVVSDPTMLAAVRRHAAQPDTSHAPDPVTTAEYRQVLLDATIFTADDPDDTPSVQ